MASRCYAKCTVLWTVTGIFFLQQALADVTRICLMTAPLRPAPGSGAASLMALASSGSVQWIINDWDSYDEAWESAYAYGARDEEDAAERESDADSCQHGYCEEGVQPRAQVEGPGGAPAKPREVLLPWDM